MTVPYFLRLKGCDEMKVLAFDQSTKISAYSIFINGEYAECGCIDLHKMKDTSERVRAMGVELCKVIEKYNPDKIVIEEVAQQSNPLTLKLLARIQGIIIGFCAAHNISTYIVEPSKWRSTLGFKQGSGIKREELKTQAIKHVKDVYHIDLSEDECEACSINEAAHKIYKWN
jgi:Holliday junction resolvasome RuvABC endonuclease subunit